MRGKMKRLAWILVAGILISGCATHQTTFMSQPAGATVFVNGEVVGQTPCSFCYQGGAEKDFQVRVEHQGYQAMQQSVSSDEVDAKERSKWLAAGVVWSPLWIGTMFTHRLKDSYEFILRENPGEMTARN